MSLETKIYKINKKLNSQEELETLLRGEGVYVEDTLYSTYSIFVLNRFCDNLYREYDKSHRKDTGVTLKSILLTKKNILDFLSHAREELKQGNLVYYCDFSSAMAIEKFFSKLLKEMDFEKSSIIYKRY